LYSICGVTDGFYFWPFFAWHSRCRGGGIDHRFDGRCTASATPEKARPMKLHALPEPSNNTVFPGMARPDDLLASRSLA
jgi:hypothetical protein